MAETNPSQTPSAMRGNGTTQPTAPDATRPEEMDDPSSAELLDEGPAGGDGAAIRDGDGTVGDDGAAGRDDSEENGEREEYRKQVQERLLSVEMEHQKGVEVRDDKAYLPGRVPLMPVTLLEILFLVIGGSAALIHFSIREPHYLLALFVFSGILFVQIVIYHSSYRAQRHVMAAIHAIGTIGITAFVAWAFADILMHPHVPGPHAFLAISLVSFVLVPLLMFLHLVFLGRGSREVTIPTQRNKPTTIMPPAKDTDETVTIVPGKATPTKIIPASGQSNGRE